MYHQATRRADVPVAEGELDLHLARTLRRTSLMRQGFYVVVLLVALAGQVSGAVEALHIPVAAAVPAVAALELGGIVVLANADVRRRLGERAVASRLLSVAIAAGAVAFNWLAHANHLLGGFFAGMSALGYLVWLMHTENQRRDRLRAKGDLPPTTPAYEVLEHWIRHPWLTHRARAMAKENPELGLYDSLAAARAEIRRERRQAAISKVLHRKIRSAVDPTTADIAVHVYDLDEIATRLAAGADYDGLTALIAADLAPARLAGEDVVLPAPPPIRAVATEAVTTEVEPEPAPSAIAATPEPAPADTTEQPAPTPVLLHDVRRQLDGMLPARQAGSARAELDASTMPTDSYPVVTPTGRTGRATRSRQVPTPRTVPSVDAPTAAEPVRARTDATPPAEPATGRAARTGRESSLRSRVHAALDRHVPAGDTRDESELVDLVTDKLELDGAERHSAMSYVQSWRREVAPQRTALPASTRANGTAAR